MPSPEVPKDWLAPAARWGVRPHESESARQWIEVESMSGYKQASTEQRFLWLAYRRSSQIQNAICIEINARLPRLGYRHRTELAWDPSNPAAERRTLIGRSSLANILSGQRFITLKEVAQLERVLGGGLITVRVLAAEHDDQGPQPERRDTSQRRGSGPRG